MSTIKFTNYGSDSITARRSRNSVPLKKVVAERFQRLWRDAARVFVLTAAEAMSVDSGMSVASLRPLAATLKIRNILVAQFNGFGPKFHGYDYESRKGGGGDDLGARHEGAFGHRSMNRGELMGRKAYKISYGSNNRLLMTFSFEAVVYQHIFWEDKWDSLGKGEQAMVLYIDDNFDKSPYNVTELIIKWFSGDSI